MSFHFGLDRFLFIFSFFLFCVQFDWILFVLSVVFVVFFRLLVRLSVSSLLSVRGFLCVMTTYPSYCTYFPVYYSLPLPSQVEECLELLVSVGRVPEAAFMARTYLPSAMGRLVALWKKDLAKVSTKVGERRDSLWWWWWWWW